MKTLKLWNGRWYEDGKTKHCYIAAYSRADAGRLYVQAGGSSRSVDAEIRDYFSEGCWGTSMEGITPERGIWIDDDPYTDNSKPIRRI